MKLNYIQYLMSNYLENHIEMKYPKTFILGDAKSPGIQSRNCLFPMPLSGISSFTLSQKMSQSRDINALIVSFTIPRPLTHDLWPVWHLMKIRLFSPSVSVAITPPVVCVGLMYISMLVLRCTPCRHQFPGYQTCMTHTHGPTAPGPMARLGIGRSKLTIAEAVSLSNVQFRPTACMEVCDLGSQIEVPTPEMVTAQKCWSHHITVGVDGVAPLQGESPTNTPKTPWCLPSLHTRLAMKKSQEMILADQCMALWVMVE